MRWWLAGMWALGVVLIAACRPATPVAQPQDAPLTLTAEAAPTERPTRTPRPSATPTPRPASVRENCADAPPTRLILSERGQVTDDEPSKLNVRSGPGIEFQTVGALEILEVFFVIDGPRCSGDYAWYLIQSATLRGWVAEGDFFVYYVEPYFPG